ncbi:MULTISPECIES: thiamine diphosphokinase [Zunongwangia]|jgi:thiamine pyrophosphokinase|uniref:Thiamine diphosphokinase n=2 Tax=Zunongwangia profunda TaxID=398743 RepID=D5BA29_ZUNPS|nr:thiamine diphosphokinase [Zunongwangia profunda]ADF52327.1 thiamine pyrophosphokinase [Zunongwangia profunda SM-A87]MAC65310.1 thiamine diphosphokinase [Flavobacteriaceae bacterium]HCV82758.1 thiamine diphosphokinase [Zunongwangia profunda]|tara:strand:- start:4669 stop:5313 length:645 start_codon:yes stop_codon:yes gene_type:complete
MKLYRETHRFEPQVVLFINGQFPKTMPLLDGFKKIYCTDGAYAKLLEHGIQPDLVSGDFDSLALSEINAETKIVETPDQNATDFEKILKIIIEEGFKSVAVYGCSGLEQDHFLGNLNSMLKHKNEIEIRCFDDFGFYFFAENSMEITGFKDEIISLFPFPEAKSVFSKGVKYPLDDEDLSITTRIGTRNTITGNTAHIRFKSGNLLVFVQSTNL